MMNKFLQENNIEYKITGIYNDTYKFELNNINFHCKISGIKKTYYTMIVYVSQEIYEIKYNLLKNKIKLLGIIEHINIVVNMTMLIKLLISFNCLCKFYFLYKLIKNKKKQ